MLRVATGLSLSVGLVACLFLPGPLPWLAAVTVAASFCAFELSKLLAGQQPGSPAWVLPPLVLATIATLLYGERLLGSSETMLLAVVVIVVPSIVTLLQGRPEQVWPVVPWLTFGALYCAVPAVATIRLREEAGPWAVLLLLAVLGLGDTAAYYCGKTWGVRKLAPALSPKKTWVGSLGGVSAALVVAGLWSWFRLQHIDPLLLLLAVATQVVGQCGDLLESAIKRTGQVKDSGNMLPGHGGFLDRADATLLAAPVFLLGVRLFGVNWG